MSNVQSVKCCCLILLCYEWFDCEEVRIFLPGKQKILRGWEWLLSTLRRTNVQNSLATDVPLALVSYGFISSRGLKMQLVSCNSSRHSDFGGKKVLLNTPFGQLQHKCETRGLCCALSSSRTWRCLLSRVTYGSIWAVCRKECISLLVQLSISQTSLLLRRAC